MIPRKSDLFTGVSKPQTQSSATGTALPSARYKKDLFGLPETDAPIYTMHFTSFHREVSLALHHERDTLPDSQRSLAVMQVSISSSLKPVVMGF